MPECDTIHLELPASYKYLNVMGACVTEMLLRVEDLPEAALVASKVQLAVHEVCTNIVKHAYAGQPGGRITATLTLTTSPSRLVVELTDRGRPFTPPGPPAPDLTQPQEGGYGLFLVRSLMDEVAYSRAEPGVNHWRLMKVLN